jgi:hypothetical protein
VPFVRGRFCRRLTAPGGIGGPVHFLAGAESLGVAPPEMFATKGEAETWLVKKETEILKDEWLRGQGTVPWGTTH